MTNFSGIVNADAAIAAAGDSVSYGVGDSAGWFAIGAVMYVAYNLLAGVPFMSEMGREASSRKEAVLGGAIGGAVLGICALLLNLAMLSSYAEASQYEVPVLHFAQQISPIVGFLFTIILLAEIYNTAVPMLWTVASQFVDEKKDMRKYRFLLCFLTVIMLIGGQLPFGVLVGLIYPFVGYFGIAFMAIIVVYYIRWAFKRRKGSGDIA